MDKGQKIVVAVLAGILLVALVVLAVVLITREPEVVIAEFKAPPFEENAVLGVPDGVPDIENYREINMSGNYKFALAGTPMLEENKLFIHFSSSIDNGAWLLIKVYDMSDNEIGKSGLVRAGEYLESVNVIFDNVVDSVKVKIVSYEHDTYYSLGTASATLPIIKK